MEILCKNKSSREYRVNSRFISNHVPLILLQPQLEILRIHPELKGILQRVTEVKTVVILLEGDLILTLG